MYSHQHRISPLSLLLTLASILLIFNNSHNHDASQNSVSKPMRLFAEATRHEFSTSKDRRTVIGPIGKPFGFLVGGSYRILLRDYSLKVTDLNRIKKLKMRAWDRAKRARSHHHHHHDKDGHRRRELGGAVTTSTTRTTTTFAGGFVLKRFENEVQFARYMDTIVDRPYRKCAWRLNGPDSNKTPGKNAPNQAVVKNATTGDVDKEDKEMNIVLLFPPITLHTQITTSDGDEEEDDREPKEDLSTTAPQMFTTTAIPPMMHTFTTPKEEGMYFLIYQVCATTETTVTTRTQDVNAAGDGGGLDQVMKMMGGGEAMRYKGHGEWTSASSSDDRRLSELDSASEVSFESEPQAVSPRPTARRRLSLRNQNKTPRNLQLRENAYDIFNADHDESMSLLLLARRYDVQSTFDLHLSMHNVDAKGRTSYLTAGDRPLPTMCFLLGGVYAGLMVLWMRLLKRGRGGSGGSSRMVGLGGMVGGKVLGMVAKLTGKGTSAAASAAKSKAKDDDEEEEDCLMPQSSMGGETKKRGAASASAASPTNEVNTTSTTNNGTPTLRPAPANSNAPVVVHHIHHMMTLLLLIKCLSLLAESARLHYVRIYGHTELWSTIYYGLVFLKGIMLFTTILLIGSGWSFLKPFLHSKEKKVVCLVLVLQILDNIALLVVNSETEGEKLYQDWTGILHFFDILCCVAVLVPIVWQVSALEKTSAAASGKGASTGVEGLDTEKEETTTTSLDNNGNEDGNDSTNNKLATSESAIMDRREYQQTLVKLKLFRSFYLLVVSYIYFTRIIVYLLGSILEFRYTWLREFASELGTLLFYVFAGWEFRPRTENPYLELYRKKADDDGDGVYDLVALEDEYDDDGEEDVDAKGGSVKKQGAGGEYEMTVI